MAEVELEQARSFAFAVDAAFKEAQRGMCADATKQGECRALKAIRDDIWAVEGKIREAKWATDAGDKAFLSKQIDPLMQQVLDKCEAHRDQVQTCQELLQDIHNWCEQRGTSAHRVRVEPSATAKAASVRYSGDCAGAGTGTASSRIPGYRSPTKQRAAQQASGAADSSGSQQASGVKAMAAGFSRIPQPQKQLPGRRASLPDAQQRPQDTTDQAQASSDAQPQQQSAAATTGQERLSRNSSSGGSVRGSGGSASSSGGVAAAGPAAAAAAAGSGSASKGAAAGGVGARVAPRSLLQMEPSRDDVALSSAGQLLQQSSSSGAASTPAVAAPSVASASAAPASHAASRGPYIGSGAAEAAVTAVTGSPARSLHAQLMTPSRHAVAPAHITRADELAALEAAYGPVDELTQLPPLRGTPAAGGGGSSSYGADHSVLMQQRHHQEMMGYSSGGDYFPSHPGSSHHTMLGHQQPPYLTSSTAAYQHLPQLHAGGGGLMMGAGGVGIGRSSADVAAILQRSGLMESALLASTSRVHVVHDAVAHKPTRKPGRGDVPDVPVVPASLAVQHKRRRQPRSLLGRLVRAVAGTVVAAAVTTAGVVAYKEAEENGLLPGKLGQRSGDGASRQHRTRAAAASDALLFVPMGPAPDASAGCG